MRGGVTRHKDGWRVFIYHFNPSKKLHTFTGNPKNLAFEAPVEVERPGLSMDKLPVGFVDAPQDLRSGSLRGCCGGRRKQFLRSGGWGGGTREWRFFVMDILTKCSQSLKFGTESLGAAEGTCPLVLRGIHACQRTFSNVRRRASFWEQRSQLDHPGRGEPWEGSAGVGSARARSSRFPLQV